MMTTERIINMRNYNNRCPDWAFRMDRATPYGNPFRIGQAYSDDGHLATRTQVCNYHKDWLLYSDKGLEIIDQFLKEWDGIKPLACWCWPQACHCSNFLEVWDERNN